MAAKHTGPVRVPLVAGNWKMHKTAAEARATARELISALVAGAPRGIPGEVLILPPFTTLWAVREQLQSSPLGLALGAQDLHWAASGAHTGEVSAAMLLDAGCAAVLAGHSERRHLMGETDEMVARKVHAALTAGLVPVLCVGETSGQREAGQTGDVLSTQVAAALSGIAAHPALGRLVIAYEPVWAIGTGTAAGPADASAAADLIRSLLPASAAGMVRVLYGGSVNAANVAEFMLLPGMDGVLVGGASLDGAGFAQLALTALAAKLGQ